MQQIGYAAGADAQLKLGFVVANPFCNDHISHVRPSSWRPPTSYTMKRANHAVSPASAHLGFLLDELRSAGVTTYAELAAALNGQGIRPARGRWTAHDLYLVMRRHRRAHPGAALNVGATLYARRAEEARRVMRRLMRRGLKARAMIARALNARGLTTPGLGRGWTARSVSRVLTASPKRRKRMRRVKATLR